ncbi:hypothetical protein [Streptomyces sp. NPDC047525]
MTQIAAVAELVWDALDANATLVYVELRREWEAVGLCQGLCEDFQR